MSSERIKLRLAVFEETARVMEIWTSPDGRVGAADVERMLGWKPGSLAARLREGRAPAVYRIGGNGHKQTVFLKDLAEWFESNRIDDDQL